MGDVARAVPLASGATPVALTTADAIFFRAVCFLRPGGNDGSALRRAPNPHPPLRECVPTLVGAN